jgi:hypothetical protein
MSLRGTVLEKSPACSGEKVSAPLTGTSDGASKRRVEGKTGKSKGPGASAVVVPGIRAGVHEGIALKNRVRKWGHPEESGSSRSKRGAVRARVRERAIPERIVREGLHGAMAKLGTGQQSGR